MSLKLIIFDLDGTLVDTVEDITDALNYAIEPFNLKPLSAGETVIMVGEGVTRLVEKVLREENAGLRDEVLDRFLDYYSGHLVVHTRPYPNVRETLETLKEVKKAVISNKREALSKKLLEELRLAAHFDLVVGPDTISERKPSPAPVLYALKKLGAAAEEAIIVGDSNFDIEAGLAAGVRTVAVTYGYRDRSLLGDADHMVEDIGELPSLLYRLNELEDRRKEKRYTVAEVYRNYIDLRLKVGGRLVKATLLDFSGHGMRFMSSAPCEPGMAGECCISIPKSMSKVVELSLRIRHCVEKPGGFVTGASIEGVADEVWFRVFRKILEFMEQRAGEVF